MEIAFRGNGRKKKEEKKKEKPKNRGQVCLRWGLQSWSASGTQRGGFCSGPGVPSSKALAIARWQPGQTTPRPTHSGRML
ncbi:MAG: hypothetical protein KAY08_04975, partial [Giesbergeria sp.]|nr:hypothetical protein [Giesbergeria sp.]